MFCGNCGAPLPDGSQFCTQCGQQIRNNSTPSETSQIQYNLSPTQSESKTSDEPKKKEKSAGCMGCLGIIILVLMIASCFGGGKDKSDNSRKDTQKVDPDIKIVSEVSKLSPEQSTPICKKLRECGVTIKKFKRAPEIDSRKVEGAQGYRAEAEDCKKINVYIKDGTLVFAECNVYNVVKDLYSDGEVVGILSKFIISEDVYDRLLINTQHAVERKLINPNSAKFPPSYKWSFDKQEDHIEVTGYVDSKNIFNATVRNAFVVTFSTNGKKIRSIDVF